MRVVAVVALAISLALGATTAAMARCAVIGGGRLVLLEGVSSVARGGTFVLALEPSEYELSRVALSARSITARPSGCTRDECTTTLGLRPLAWNLFAVDVPPTTPLGPMRLEGLRQPQSEGPAGRWVADPATWIRPWK